MIKLACQNGELIKKKLKIFKNLDIKISKTGSEIITSSVDYF